jgi:hypothetical protein
MSKWNEITKTLEIDDPYEDEMQEDIEPSLNIPEFQSNTIEEAFTDMSKPSNDGKELIVLDCANIG